ncbi:MAG: hypothetical protein FWG92_08505 [Leptospirales bacterium]|nr:hypothetical protein [Leptospirales bacterium]
MDEKTPNSEASKEKTQSYTPFRHISCPEMKRELPDDCDWACIDTAVLYKGDNQATSAGERQYGPESELASISCVYECRGKLFPPWYFEKKLKEHFQKNGMKWNLEDCYEDHKYEVVTKGLLPGSIEPDSWKQFFRIYLRPKYKGDFIDKKVYGSFAKIVEDFLVSGFMPGEGVPKDLMPASVHRQIVVTDLDGHGRREVEEAEIYVSNDEDQLIFQITDTYSTFLYNVIVPFVKLFNENVTVTEGPVTNAIWYKKREEGLIDAYEIRCFYQLTNEAPRTFPENREKTLIDRTEFFISHFLSNGYTLTQINCSGHSNSNDWITAHRAYYYALDDFKQNALKDYYDYQPGATVDFSLTISILKGKGVGIRVSLENSSDGFSGDREDLTVTLYSFTKDAALSNESLLHSISVVTEHEIHKTGRKPIKIDKKYCHNYGLDLGDGQSSLNGP